MHEEDGPTNLVYASLDRVLQVWEHVDLIDLFPVEGDSWETGNVLP